MLKIEDCGRIIFQAPRANNCVPIKPLPCPKTFKASLQ